MTKKEGGVDDFTKSLVGCGDDVGEKVEEALDFMTFGGSEGKSMALSRGGKESGVGSFMDSVHVEMRGPGGEKEIDTVNDVEETSDGGVTGFEIDDVVVSPVGEFGTD